MSFSQYKICKQVGENIWTIKKPGKNNSAKYEFQKIKKSSLYYKLYRQEKILRTIYGNLTHQQFKNILKINYKNAHYKQNPLLRLETRLSIIISRLNWGRSIFEAKQLILHKNILVNGRIITYSNYLLKPGDIVQLKQTKILKVLNTLEEKLSKKHLDFLPFLLPDYIQVNYNIMTAILLYIPTTKEIPYIVHLQPQLMKQFYQLY
jgi:small subunit ribosomal protein S4